jgi:hypothetical protein
VPRGVRARRCGPRRRPSATRGWDGWKRASAAEATRVAEAVSADARPRARWQSWTSPPRTGLGARVLAGGRSDVGAGARRAARADPGISILPCATRASSGSWPPYESATDRTRRPGSRRVPFRSATDRPQSPELLEAKLAQLGPARIRRALVRVAGLLVEVRAALRAQAGAVRAAQDLVGERERVRVAGPLGDVEDAVLYSSERPIRRASRADRGPRLDRRPPARLDARRGAWMLAGLMLKTRGCEQQRGGPCRHAPAGVQGEATDAVLEGGAAPGRATRRWPRCGSRRPVPARHRRTAWRRRDAGARVSSRAAA